MLWTSSYLWKVRDVSQSTATACASLFFIGISVGRFLAGIISNRLGDHRMIRIGTGIAVVGLAGMMIPTDSAWMAMGGAILFGLGCAPIYPAIIHATPDLYGEKYAQAIIGVQMASAYTGSTFMPPVLGWISEFVSLKIMPYYMLGFFVLMIVMVEMAFRLKPDADGQKE